MEDGLAFPISSTLWTESSTAADPRTRLVGRRRAAHGAPTSHESEALADAGAWFEAQQVALTSRINKLRRTVNDVPCALRVSDVLALLVESAIIQSGVVKAILFAATVLACRTTMRQYRQRLSLSMLDDIPRAVGSTLAAVGLTLAAAALLTGNPPPESEILQRATCFLVLSLAFEAVTFAALRHERRRARGGRRTLIVGAGRVGETLSAALNDYPELGLTPIGFLDPDGPTNSGGTSLPVLTTDMSRLAYVIAEHEIDTTILAFDGAGDAHIDTVLAVHQTGCDLVIVPSLFELNHCSPDVEHVRGVPLLRLRANPTLHRTWWIKRTVDITVGLLGLLLLLVPMALVALTILIDSGRPVLFWQERIGMNGKVFRLCKFRSLRPQSERESQTTWNIAGDPRLGRVGTIIRRTSIDEIPQLWNIVRGQMSLVGPRPERPTFVQKFTHEHDRYWARHRVPVGLTGLAQINGLRGDTSIRERARYDNYYIANWSLWLDLKIVLLTAREVLGSRGR